MPGKVIASQDWTELDDHYDADKTVIVPEHKRLTSWLPGRASVNIGIGVGVLAAQIEEALGFPRPNRVLTNDHERLAYDLFSASFFESSEKAKFLTLVMTLEALAPDTATPDYIREHVDDLRDQTKRQAEEHTTKDARRQEYQSLLRPIGQLENAVDTPKSIGPYSQ